jgi:hypothetical protein
VFVDDLTLCKISSGFSLDNKDLTMDAAQEHVKGYLYDVFAMMSTIGELDGAKVTRVGVEDAIRLLYARESH